VLTFVALGGEGKTSLVAKWAAQLAHEDWPGCEAVFAWSFYSQGTSERTQASSDSFLKEALLFFGDVEMANSAAGSIDKGRRLAQLIGERRALLILDGLEPLQYAPTSPTESELKDQGVSALLKALATKSDGLCVVTTRYSIPDLRNFWQSTSLEIKLTSLLTQAGIALLRKLEVKGTQKEFEQLVTDVRGHALTLNLLGSFLRDAHAGDIRKRYLVKLEEADAEEQSGHAFHVMDAYVKSFKDEGEKGKRALSILRLLGLFDRPATFVCLNALWTGEEIGGLNGPLLGINEAQRNITLKRLEDAHLVTVNREQGTQVLVSLDAHPLLREYFATRIRLELPGGWRAAHRRLYEHLRDTTQEGDEPTLEDLQPLYQAVAHGCQAHLQQEACNDVYFARILRGLKYFSSRRLGAIASNLGAVACFFDPPWINVSPALSPPDQAWLLGEASYYLRALGRLTEASQPMLLAVNFYEEKRIWKQAAQSANNLSELKLMLGEVSVAVREAERSVMFADRSGEAFWKMGTRTTLADSLFQSGRHAEAEAHFREAEQRQKELQPDYPMLYGLQGFRFCDFLLAVPERAAWQTIIQRKLEESRRETAIGFCYAVSQRAAQTLRWYDLDRDVSLYAIGLDHLSVGRSRLYLSILEKSGLEDSENDIENATTKLVRAAVYDYLIHTLVSRAWPRFLRGARTGPESAQADLDEAWEIAERGPMRLHMADIHLYRARLFHAVKPYPWNRNPDGTERGPKDDLKDARKLIEQCGYWRRKEELEDAEEAAKNWK
jgi:DNA-binding transcriptional ArsR family regulator